MQRIALIMLSTCLMASSAMAQVEASGGNREAFRQKMKERLERMDTNGDKAISKAEFMAEAEKKFSTMDANGDGSITPEERAAMREKFKSMQRQTDGADAVP